MDAHFLQQSQLLRYQLSKLQAYKSSFQAWKCVSFGYALLAMVLLLSKWHEVTTDLKLLTGIDQLIWAATNGSQGNATAREPGSSFPLRSWPPVPLETLLLSAASQMQPEPAGSGAPRSNATSGGSSRALVDSLVAASEAVNSMEGALAAEDRAEAEGELSPETSANSSSGPSRLMSQHMQMLVGRELSGGQLLRQEVEAFLAEFRSAKSTLGLSSLLVAVYIVSWILMTLAVNDARISNDVSLRNILVLSVFGAIDMAASCGFVMVRVIMFNVKNNHFVTQILGSSGLRESSVRLSADQLTAFTALRLIAMRSCSAYVDVYVSVLVALLTFLRLYAIIRAVAYYRFLRHFNDCNRNLQHQQQLAAAFHNSASPGGRPAHEESKQQLHFLAYDHGALRADSISQPKTIWHQQQQPGGQQANMSSNPQASSIFVQHVPHAGSARATPVQQFALEPQVILTSPTGQTTTFVASAQQAGQQTLRSAHMRPTCGASKHPPSPADLPGEPPAGQFHRGAPSPAGELPRSAHKSTNQHHRSPQLLLTTANLLAHQPEKRAAAAELVQTARRRQQPQPQLGDSSTPNFLLVNGKPHRLVATGARERRARQRASDEPNMSDFSLDANNGFESEPVVRRGSRKPPVDGNNNIQSASPKQPASFTLLSESQLNRLSRKLMAKNSAGAEANGRDTERTPSSVALSAPSRQLLAKYKVLARYRPVKQGSSLIRSLSKRGRHLLGGERASQPSARAKTSQLRSGKHSLVDELEREFGYSSSGTTDEASSSSASAPEGRLEGEELVEVDSDAGLTFADLLGGARGPEARWRRTRSKRLSRRVSPRPAGGTSRALPSGLRQTEECNLPPATSRENRELLLRKYYYA